MTDIGVGKTELVNTLLKKLNLIQKAYSIIIPNTDAIICCSCHHIELSTNILNKECNRCNRCDHLICTSCIIKFSPDRIINKIELLAKDEKIDLYNTLLTQTDLNITIIHCNSCEKLTSDNIEKLCTKCKNNH